MARIGKVKGPTYVVVSVRISFDGFRAGEVYTVERDALVEAWLQLGLVEVVHTMESELELEVSDSGEDPAGPSSVEQDVPGNEQERG